MGPIDPRYAGAMAFSKLMGIKPKERKALRRALRYQTMGYGQVQGRLQDMGLIAFDFTQNRFRLTELGITYAKALTPTEEPATNDS